LLVDSKFIKEFNLKLSVNIKGERF